jgi:CRP-like cAMP-binding protein
MSSRAPLQSAALTFEKQQVLKNHPLFAKFRPEVLARLCTYVVARKFKRGTLIFSRGDPGTCLFVVASGSIKIGVQSAGGKDAVFNLINVGGIFGEIALLDGKPRTADAVAATDCQLLILERRDFIPLIDTNPEIALQLIEVLCERIRHTSDQVEDVIFLDLERRLAKTLLWLSEAGKSTPLGRKVTITQREIGQIIGMSRESTNKQLRAWQDRKWLKIERGGMTILQPAALTKLAFNSA